MDEDSGSWWGKRCLIKVKGTVKLGTGGEFGVDSGRLEEVQREESLGKQSIPEMEGEMLVG